MVLLFDLDLHQCFFLAFAFFFLHNQGYSSIGCFFFSLFLLIHLLLESKEFQPHLLFLLKFSLLFFEIDITLEILELILNGSFALLIIIDRFRNRFNRSISDGNQYWLFIFTLFFTLNLLLFFSHLFFDIRNTNLIFNNLLHHLILSIFLLLLVAETILGVQKGTSYICFYVCYLRLWLLYHQSIINLTPQQTISIHFYITFLLFRIFPQISQPNNRIIYLSYQMMKQILFFSLLFCMTVSNYSEILGEKLCKLSLASYCKKHDIQKWTCKPCQNSPLVLRNIKTFENSTMDTLGFIGTSDEMSALVLVFRGTLFYDLKNWISDINFIAVNYPICKNNCKVHRGFYYAFLDIQKQVLQTVASYRQQYPQYTNIVVTGHSLGAAIATHVAAHLMHNKYKVADFYTFGSPRVGDPKFSAWFNEIYGGINHFKARVTHRRDPVPHLPLSDWGFTHLNTEVFYKGSKKQGAVTCNDSTGEDKQCSDRYLIDADILDHLNYYDIDFVTVATACQI